MGLFIVTGATGVCPFSPELDPLASVTGSQDTHRKSSHTASNAEDTFPNRPFTFYHSLSGIFWGNLVINTKLEYLGAVLIVIAFSHIDSHISCGDGF